MKRWHAVNRSVGRLLRRLHGFRRHHGSVLFLLFEDIESHVVDRGIVENHDAAIGSRLDVHSGIFPELVVASAEVVSYGLYGYIELVGDLVCRTVGQAVFESAQLVECNSLSHNKDDLLVRN